MTTPEFNTTFDCDTWSEEEITTLEGSNLRMTRTRSERTFKGALEGKAIIECTWVYHPVPGYVPPVPKEGEDDSKDPYKGMAGNMCTYIGVMYFNGKAGGYESSGDGELAFTYSGTWGKGGERKAVGDWTVIPGSGKGGLAGVTAGSGGDVSSGKTEQPCWFKLE